MTKIINRLREIALNKKVFESSEEHIDLLIETEKSEHKPGWQTRLEGLELLKKQKRLLREVYNNENKSLNEMKQFISDSMNLEQKLKEDKDGNCIVF